MLFFAYLQKQLLARQSVRFKKKRNKLNPNNSSRSESLNVGISSFYPAHREEPSVSKPHPGISGRLAVRANNHEQLPFWTDFWFKVFHFCLTILWLCCQLVSIIQKWSDLLVTGFHLQQHLKVIILKRRGSSSIALSVRVQWSCKSCLILRFGKQLLCMFKYLMLRYRLGNFFSLKMNPSGELISQRHGWFYFDFLNVSFDN